MTSWLVAPDATTNPDVTVASIGAAGYGLSWKKAIKWSDFNQTNSVMKTLFVSGDEIVCLEGRYLLSAAVGGWATLSTSFANFTLRGERVNGTPGYAQFRGGRTWPWPHSALTGYKLAKIAVASNGVALPTGTINVDSTAGFQAAGQITIGSINQTVTYTGITSTSFTGCTGGTGTLATNQNVTTKDNTTAGETFSLIKRGAVTTNIDHLMFAHMQYGFTTTGRASTTVASGSNGVALPTGTINVASTANFASSGILTINSLGSNIAYTGVTSTSFTGCTGGTGTLTTGATIVEPVPNLGTFNATNCFTLNDSFCLFTTGTKTDGMMNYNSTDARQYAYSGSSRIWGKGNLLRHVGNSEYLWTTTNPNTADQTYGFNSKDAHPQYSTGVWPCSLSNVVLLNHEGGTSGGSYTQGDGAIFEENVGSFTAIDVLTSGNGDRGLDAKCQGTIVGHIGLGDGYASAHHKDDFPMDVIGASYFTKPRNGVTGTPSGCVQASGWIRAFQSSFTVLPTAADIANNPHVVAVGNTDVSKDQSSTYGANHKGIIYLQDCAITLGTTVGAAEISGFTSSADSARNAPIFGLAAGSTNLFKVRAVGYDGAGAFTRSAWTSTVSFTMNAPTLGDSTAPATPTGLSTTAVTGGLKHQFQWNAIAQDAGVSIQGYIISIDLGDGAGFVPTYPGKTNSPLIISGFTPGAAGNVKVAAFDAAGNVSAYSAAVAFTAAAAANPATSSVAVPTAPAVAALWSDHPSMAHIQWGAPASGTVAFFEVGDNAGTVVARTFPIAGIDGAATYTKQNVKLVTV